MAYKRKTQDEWQLWSNYGYGWDHELSEDTWREMREQLKCYRANCPKALFMAKKVRARIETNIESHATGSTWRRLSCLAVSMVGTNTNQ